MAPAKYRGAFNNGFHLTLCLGNLIASLVNFGTQKIKAGWGGWRLSLAIAAVPASILTLGALFLPETPNSLIQRRRQQKAAAVLQKIRGTTHIQAELDDLIQASEVAEAAENRSPFRNIIQKRYRPQLVMAVALPFFQQFTGIGVLGLYAPILFRTIGFRESASLISAVILVLTGTLSTLAAMTVVDRVGRRRLFIVGGIVMLFTQTTIGGIMAAKLSDHGNGGLSEGYAYVLLVLISTYVAGFSFSWGPLAWLIPSEIFQLEIRSAGQSITVAVSFLFTFLLAQTLLTILCHFKAWIFFFFAGWTAVMTAFIYLLLPETKNMPIEKIGEVWKEHWLWKRIVADDANDGNEQQINCGVVEMG